MHSAITKRGNIVAVRYCVLLVNYVAVGEARYADIAQPRAQYVVLRGRSGCSGQLRPLLPRYAAIQMKHHSHILIETR